jgi:hypothetical protein
MRHHNLQVTGSVVVNGLGVATASELTAYTASTDAKISTLQSFTSSASGRLNSIETITASNIARISSLEATSASVDTLNTTQNTRLTSLENKTGSLATTGSNTFIGTQIFSGSLYVQNNLIVQGSSSLQNITASAVSIGTNTVLLNTNNPSVRFGGISVTDSGSAAGKSGSLYFDSTDDEWIFVHAGNTAVTSSTMITGPETFDNIGNETHLTDNIIPKSKNGFHIYDSCIFDNGTTTCVKNNLIGTGTACFSGQLNTITGVFGNKGGGNYGVLITDNDQSNVRLRFTNSGTGGQSMSIVGGNPAVSNSGLAIYDETAGATRLYINSSGNVGINTSNPQSLLDVQNCIDSPYLNTNTLTSGQWLRLSNLSTCQGANSGILFVATGPGGGNALATINGIAVACGSMSLTFATRDASSNVTEKMRILSVGTVAIGTQTSSPQTHAGGNVGGLIVQGLNNCRGLIEVWDAVSGKGLFQQVGGTTYIGNLCKGASGGDLQLMVNGTGISATPAMVITCQGRILINNNAQNSCADYSRVTISGTCNKNVPGGVGGSVLHLTTFENDFPFGAKFNLNGNTCNCLRYLSIQTGDHNLFNQGNIILQQSGGNVGIGTTSPNITGFNGTMLTVNGTGNYQGLEIASSDVARMTLLTDGAGSLGYVSTRQAGMSLIFETGAANEKMRIDSVGTVKYSGNFVNGNYYTADTTPSMCMLSAGQCINFCYMSGMLLVNDWNNGSTTLYLAGGGSTTMVSNAVSQTGCFWYNPAVVGYSWSNTSGTTRCFGFFVVRTRTNA